MISARHVPVVHTRAGWPALLKEPAFGEVLLPFLERQRWFGAKGRLIASCAFVDLIPLRTTEGSTSVIGLLRVNYGVGADLYLLPLALNPDVAGGTGAPPVARVDGGATGVVSDATEEPECAFRLLQAVGRRERLAGWAGSLVGWPTVAFSRVFPWGVGSLDGWAPPLQVEGEQSNTSLLFRDRYADRAILKLYRRVERGVRPDLELGRVLTERGFEHTPPVAGSLEYDAPDGPATLGVLHGHVPNQGDAWRFTLDALKEYLARGRAGDAGDYLQAAAMLGRRTAEMHVTLAGAADDPAFAPEPFTQEDGERVAREMVRLSGQVLGLLRERLPDLPEPARAPGSHVLSQAEAILRPFHAIHHHPMTAPQIRGHGDLHLGQVLLVQDERGTWDFVIIDFEGEPARPLAERRRKHPSLRDVAGMLRSFDYAAGAAVAGGRNADGSSAQIRNLVRAWRRVVSEEFLSSYLAHARPAGILPQTEQETRLLLTAYQVEKAVYEVGYELNHRPEWVEIPLRALGGLVDQAAADSGGSVTR